MCVDDGVGALKTGVNGFTARGGESLCHFVYLTTREEGKACDTALNACAAIASHAREEVVGVLDAAPRAVREAGKGPGGDDVDKAGGVARAPHGPNQTEDLRGGRQDNHNAAGAAGETHESASVARCTLHGSRPMLPGPSQQTSPTSVRSLLRQPTPTHGRRS